MRGIIIDFLVEITPFAIGVLTATHSSNFIGILIGISLCGIALWIFYKHRLKQKKEAVPETLAIGYFINFIEPLLNRISKNTELISENTLERKILHYKQISVKIFKCGLEELLKAKNALNLLMRGKSMMFLVICGIYFLQLLVGGLAVQAKRLKRKSPVLKPFQQ